MTATRELERARAILRAAEGEELGREGRGAAAVELAEVLLALSRAYTTSADRARMARLARLMDDRPGQLLTAALTDRLVRSADPRRTLEQVSYLLERFGVPHYFAAHERAALWAVRELAWTGLAPVAEAVTARVRGEARALLVDAEEEALDRYLSARHREGARVNVNKLGEALLGEREAEARVAKYVELARRPHVDALSVKVSSIASQLPPLALDANAELVAERLARIYAASAEQARPPVVMLDMEAYVHVELTLEALERALRMQSAAKVRAGVVLQAYLPDSSGLLERVVAIARAQRERGAAPLWLRIVKGANLAHELVESAKAGMRSPIFAHKREVDAHYKRLLERALERDLDEVLGVGIASHNLFDLSYALLLRAERRRAASSALELLEGMADPVRRALAALQIDHLLYAPICRDDELNSAIAYLVRRLDENTSSDNYLRSSFALGSGGESAPFARERERFLAALALVDSVDDTPRRAGEPAFDRTRPPAAQAHEDFRGEVDTDFSRPENRAWIADTLARYERAEPATIHSRIAGRSCGGALRDGCDPSRVERVPYRFSLADEADIARALDCAARDPAGYSSWSAEQRAHLLVRCAANLRDARAQLIAALVLDGGKRVVEADAEVSEAIDFAEYYRASFMQLRSEPFTFTPRGVVLVTPPWNFPLAITAGGVLAALMAGCRVLLKPALETPYVGERLARLLWSAGVPDSALQLVLCEDEVGSALVRDARVDSVILTGATATARLFQRLRPGLRLLAETGGKNAYVVSAMSDRELAIRDVVQSAFGHAGQKCSAASLLICESEVYDDPSFRATLRDAVESLHVGSAWDPRSFVTPLIRAPEQPLSRALTTLEPGETWLVEPRFESDNPRLVSPGVKLGVQPGGFTHTTELFGPLLGVMRARSLEHAVELANATGYGLTAGLASLDEREQRYFCDHVRAGNVYVNRSITGAIVERQPFGGIGNSGFGPGAKAGGPNYVAQLCHLHAAEPSRPSERLPEPLEARVGVFARALDRTSGAKLRARAADYARAMHEHFAREHDPAQIVGQHNRFRYLPCEGVVLRVEFDADPIDIASSCLAAEIAHASIVVSIDPRHRLLQDTTVLGFPLRSERVDELVERAQGAVRLRLLGTRQPAHALINERHGVHLADEPVLARGRFELLHYLREQSLSIEYHRYGNLGGV